MFLICLSHNFFQQLLRHSGAGMENPRICEVHLETAEEQGVWCIGRVKPDFVESEFTLF